MTIGTAEKLAAHQPPGQLHQAFSVFLFDEQGRLLLQQRALGKYHSPACGPTPAAATLPGRERRSRRRPGTYEELGVSPSLLAEAGGSGAPTRTPPRGLVEQEFNHLFVGLVQAPLGPDPEEVAATAFVTAAELAGRHARDPFSSLVHDRAGRGPPGDQGTDGPSAGW